MARFNTLPDLEAVAATRLRSAAIVGLGTRVYSSVPKDPTYPLVTVQRIGGIPAVRQRLDAVSLQVDVWGGTKSEARDIAAAARIALLELEGVQVTDPVAANITAVDDSLGLTWAPDPVTARDRYLFGVTVYGTAGFSPTEISGLQLWLPAESIQGVANGSQVSLWSDKSGNGFNAVQATVSKQPLWIASGVNGCPAVRFDGTNDILLGPTGIEFPAMTVIVVTARTNLAAVTCRICGTRNPGTNVGWILGTSNAANRPYDCTIGTGSGTAAVGGGTSLDGALDIVAATYEAASTTTLHENGTLRGNSTLSAFSASGLAFTVGGTPDESSASFLGGDIAEVLCWNRALNTAERRKVEAYLSRRYAIPVT